MKKAMMLLLAMSAFNQATATGSSQQNLIVNGDFSQNDCTKDWCIFTNSGCVKGWTPEPQIQVGYGRIYNDCLKNQRVVQLAPNKNSCIKQSINNLQPGVYQLKFEYAARKGKSFDDCQFAVSFNGNNLKTVKPCDYQINTETIQIQVKSGCEGQVKFCGVGGNNNSYGAILKSVNLVRKSNLPQIPPIVYQPPILQPPILPPILQPPILPPILQPPIYQPPVQNLPGIYLDSHSGKCTQRQYQLQGGELQITFDYKVLANFPLKQSAIYVTLNGQSIYRVLPCDSGKTIKLKGNLPKGTHKLGFCAVGCPTQSYHQVFISNIIIYQKQCVATWGNNLVVNGDFEDNKCKSDWCIWNQKSAKSSISGWIACPEIEIGKGTVYNKALGSSWVTQLDPNRNSCIKQKLALRPGKHQLNFDWAARSGTKLQTNQFEVKVNGKVIDCFKATDCEVHKQKIQFLLDSSCPRQSWIQFCGTGKSDSYGALIDNVKLFAFDKCGSFKVVQY